MHTYIHTSYIKHTHTHITYVPTYTHEYTNMNRQAGRHNEFNRSTFANRCCGRSRMYMKDFTRYLLRNIHFFVSQFFTISFCVVPFEATSRLFI